MRCDLCVDRLASGSTAIPDGAAAQLLLSGKQSTSCVAALGCTVCMSHGDEAWNERAASP